MSSENKRKELAIKATISVVAAYILYTAIRNAAQGGFLSICFLTAGTICLNEIGKNNRPIATAAQRGRGIFGATSMGNTASNIANNVTTGTAKSLNTATKAFMEVI